MASPADASPHLTINRVNRSLPAWNATAFHREWCRAAPNPFCLSTLMPAHSSRTFSFPSLAEWSLVTGYLAAYVALDWVSYIDPIGPLGITPWNPPPGLSLFLLLRYGLRRAPWLFVAAILAEVLVRGGPAPWPVLILACSVLTAGYTAVAALLHHRLRFRNRFATLRDATVFTGAVAVATGVIAILYVSAFAAAGALPTERLVHSVAQFWIGDLIGIMVTTPVLLSA
ncbi:MAG: MASE1 domain-containing protein, partial [Casimicrobiaceae bacterium]